MINKTSVLPNTIIDNLYLKAIMANSYVLSISLALILLINTEYVSSGKCDYFKDVTVRLVDINGDKFNKTVNGCIHKKKFYGRTVTEVDVSDQVVPVLGKNSVKNMDELVDIIIWRSEVDVVEPFAFRNVPKLEIVWITYCNLEEIPNDVFSAIPNLKLLAFNNNKINFIENKAFANLTSLLEVTGSDNNLEYWNREWFEDCINLIKINFEHNKIRKIPREAFAALGLLRGIFFDHNEISIIEPHAFKGLRNLEYLSLRGNRLTVFNDDIFPFEIKLRVLHLGMNYLNFLSTEVLEKISAKEVDLHHNPWKCPCLDKINNWLSSTNGTLLKEGWCGESSSIPVCAYSNSHSQSCSENVDKELTQRYLENLRSFAEPLMSSCARLD